MATRNEITLKSAYGPTPEQARDARARAWAFIFDRYAKLGRRHKAHGDVRPGRPARRPHYAENQEQSYVKEKLSLLLPSQS